MPFYSPTISPEKVYSPPTRAQVSVSSQRLEAVSVLSDA